MARPTIYKRQSSFYSDDNGAVTSAGTLSQCPLTIFELLQDTMSDSSGTPVASPGPVTSQSCRTLRTFPDPPFASTPSKTSSVQMPSANNSSIAMRHEARTFSSIVSASIATSPTKLCKTTASPVVNQSLPTSSLSTVKTSRVRLKPALRNYYNFKIHSAQRHPRPTQDMACLQLLGMCNLLSHRVSYLEGKLNCRDEMPSKIFLEEIGETSTDDTHPHASKCVPVGDRVESVRAAHTTASNIAMELPFSNGSVSSVNSVGSGGSTDSGGGGDSFNVRVRIPEIDTQNNFCFRRDKTIWQSKLQLLRKVGSTLIDGLNYGFYQPPANGKAGKFLVEERLFSDYPTDQISMPFLEFKYKRRVYRQMKLDVKEVKKYHNKTNIKLFFESVKTRNIEKILKMTAKCMDPNIHDESTGVTPLVVAAAMKNSEDVIQALISGGAHLDFRTRQGSTAIHNAVDKNNHPVIELLLNMGTSPNSKDYKGLTPLYYNVQNGGDPMIAELLLKDRSIVNIVDNQGWTEIHHACRHGRMQHLQLLIFYGADSDGQNAAGNTPLHVCAVYNQEAAARMLLFRGADRMIKNKNSQTPFQVAIVANNFTTGEIIRNYSEDNVVPHQEAPSYNPRRRWPSATADTPGTLNRTISEPLLAGTMVNKQFVASSTNFLRDQTVQEEMSMQRRSGSIGSASSTSSAQMMHRKVQDAKAGKLYVAVKDYTALEYGELTLSKGDYVKVLSIGEFNFWEGEVGHSRGWFPSYCVHEVTGKEKAQSMRERKTNYPESLSRQTSIPEIEAEPEPRVVFVERIKKGFGFILRGAKSPQGASSSFKPTKDFPALQYLENVDKGSPADKAGLKKGDFILEINGQDVTAAPHQFVVSLVVNSPDTIVMKVITVPNSKALIWLNEAKIKSLRGKLAPASSLTKSKGEKAHQEMQALNELDEAIATADDLTEDKNRPSYASIRKRAVPQKVSPKHLTGMFTRPNSNKKPNIPLAPSAFRFNTIARMSSSKSTGSILETSAMETQTKFDDDDNDPHRRNSTSSDSAMSSLRSSPASSYSYSTTMSGDSGVMMKMTLSEAAPISSETMLSQVPPAPSYPAPTVPPAPSYPAPSLPKLKNRSQSLYNLYSEKEGSVSDQLSYHESPMGERRFSTGQKRPSKPPPPIPRRDASISEDNLIDKSRPVSLNIPIFAEVHAVPPNTGGSVFSNAIAEAAAAKKESLHRAASVDSLEAKTPLQIALAARDQSLLTENQNRNQNAETTASCQGSSQVALSEAIARRKAQLDSTKTTGDSIENKIRKYKQSDNAKNNSANQALLTAIAKRRSTIEKQMSEDSDSQSTGSEGSVKFIETEQETKESVVPPPTVKEIEIAQAAATMQARLASKSNPKEPTGSFSGHKNIVKIVPRGELKKAASPAYKSPKDTTNPAVVDAVLPKTPKSDVPPPPPPAGTYKHPLSPVKENEPNFDTSFPPPPSPLLSNGHQREHSFDTASVVSSMSSMSTVSSFSTVSTEPNGSSDILDEDESSRTNSMKSSTSSVASSATLTAGNTARPVPRVMPKPKRKSQERLSSEVLDNRVIHTTPPPEVDNKHNLTSAWNQQVGSEVLPADKAGWSSKPLSSWTAQEVGLWLVSLNLGEHRQSFEENEITGEHLTSLGKDDLQDLGIGRLGHRLTITKAVQQLAHS